MKRILLIAVLVGCSVPLPVQEWCFSKDCTDTPATIFSPNKSSKQLGLNFRSVWVLSAYTPVEPLRFSPSTRRFFLNVRPLDGIDNGLRLSRSSKTFAPGYDAMPGAIGTHQSAATKRASPVRPSFSNGQIGFTSSSGWR
jgi:hypothetical protein